MRLADALSKTVRMVGKTMHAMMVSLGGLAQPCYCRSPYHPGTCG